MRFFFKVVLNKFLFDIFIIVLLQIKDVDFRSTINK